MMSKYFLSTFVRLNKTKRQWILNSFPNSHPLSLYFYSLVNNISVEDINLTEMTSPTLALHN